jgi:two-component system, sensor histidine kinase and response regulator
VSSLAYRKRIAVNNNVPRELMIKADQNMILSILHNFIMNAIKFTNPGGHVDIDAHMMNDSRGNEPYMFISITDNGIGMNDEEMSRLFKINALYSTSGTQNEKGTGLGLLLTREMVERHGGEIHVESKPCQGSVFSFTVPASK